jgi:elongation factor Tu
MECPTCEYENTDPLATICWECEEPLALSTLIEANSFQIIGYLLSTREGGREIPLYAGTESHAYFGGQREIPMSIYFMDEFVLPGDTFEGRVHLKTPVAMEEGMKVSLVEAGKIYAEGTVIKLYP